MIRTLDIIISLLGMLLFMPVFILISIIIKLTSKGPIFYKQKRVGISNSDFDLLKFRTMKVNSDKFGLLTVGGRDSRITSFGYYLRKFKLDELPQLLNVFLGEMSLVGPRPEVRKYVDLYSDDQKKVLNIKPGITDWASVVYKDENIILERSTDPEQDYICIILPEKIRYNLIYIEKRGVIEYFKIILVTFWRIVFPVK